MWDTQCWIHSPSVLQRGALLCSHQNELVTAFLPPDTACSCYLYPVVSCFLDVAKQRDKVNSIPKLLKVREETNRKFSRTHLWMCVLLNTYLKKPKERSAGVSVVLAEAGYTIPASSSPGTCINQCSHRSSGTSVLKRIQFLL